MAKAKDPELAFDLGAFGGRVVDVGGPFNARTLIAIPTEKAEKLFAGDLAGWSAGVAVESVQHDLADLRERDAALADSALAAAALALAADLDNPYTSATARSMASRVLVDTMDRLRELAPAARKADPLDDLTAARRRRLQRHSA